MLTELEFRALESLERKDKNINDLVLDLKINYDMGSVSSINSLRHKFAEYGLISQEKEGKEVRLFLTDKGKRALNVLKELQQLIEEKSESKTESKEEPPIEEQPHKETDNTNANSEGRLMLTYQDNSGEEKAQAVKSVEEAEELMQQIDKAFSQENKISPNSWYFELQKEGNIIFSGTLRQWDLNAVKNKLQNTEVSKGSKNEPSKLKGLPKTKDEDGNELYRLG